MKYPDRIIQKGELDKGIVRAIQKQLNYFHCGSVFEDGDFGNLTLAAKKLEVPNPMIKTGGVLRQ